MNPPTLTEALAARGYTHRKASMGQHRIYDSAGEVVFVGRAHEIWAWLHDTADIARDPEGVVETIGRVA